MLAADGYPGRLSKLPMALRHPLKIIVSPPTRVPAPKSAKSFCNNTITQLLRMIIIFV
jgi:hypothetical protein